MIGARGTKVAIGALLALALAAGGPAHADEIYVYKKSDGTRLFTDQKNLRDGATFIRKFGRPTAYSSCNRMTPGTLKTRADALQPLVDKHAAEHGVPPTLVRAVMQVESCFDRRAVSRVGARGLMQLMPGTAADLGVRDSFDPSQNIAGGARYLSMMRKRFNDDWNLALAAYNAGPGAVEKYDGIPPYPETQNYVRRVMKLYRASTAAAPVIAPTPAPTQVSVN